MLCVIVFRMKEKQFQLKKHDAEIFQLTILKILIQQTWFQYSVSQNDTLVNVRPKKNFIAKTSEAKHCKIVSYLS